MHCGWLKEGGAAALRLRMLRPAVLGSGQAPRLGSGQGSREEYGVGGGHVGLGDSVLPGEVVFVPQSPEETEEESAAAEQIAEAAPEERGERRRRAVEGDHGEGHEVHPRRGRAQERKKSEVLSAKEKEGEEVNQQVCASQARGASEGNEQAQEESVGDEEKGGVEKACAHAVVQTGHRNQGGDWLMDAFLGRTEIEMRLPCGDLNVVVTMRRLTVRSGPQGGAIGCIARIRRAVARSKGLARI